MNISSITYSNYQYGFSPPHGSKAESNDSGLPQKNSRPAAPAENQDTRNPVSQPSGAGTPSTSNTASASDDAGAQTDTNTTQVNGHELTPEELKLLDTLKQSDTDVKQHEMAHIAAGGQYITSGATFSYKRGPDGKNYAVGGEVSIDTSPVPGDPQATLQKMRQIKSAALAPAAPSSQDLKVASKATSAASEALSDLMILKAKEQADPDGTTTSGTPQKAADSYEKAASLTETGRSSFQIAV